MAAPKGHPRYGGRKKGTPNKSSLNLIAQCDERGINLFQKFLDIIEDDDADVNLRFNALKEAASYVYPKRKAIEHSVDPETVEAIEASKELSKEEQIKVLEEALLELKK